VPRAEPRGHRIPDEWTPDAALIEDMRREGIPDDLARRELLKFRDYWASQPGVKGRKTDWRGVWRNWLRKASENYTGPAANGAGRATAKAQGWMDLSDGASA
jgi:hypothetical protein